IYAVYSLGALAALLILGRLSDHVGRARVVALGLVIQVAGALTFIAAQDSSSLYLARILQGVATGIAITALSAWLVDLQPPEKRSFAGLVGAAAPMAGLATGALGSGALVQYAPDPLHLVFWLLAAAFLLALVAIWFIPDSSARNGDWRRTMRPQ